MLITTYTSYDEVRAVLGVSKDELEDDTLSLPVYGHSLITELYQLDAALVSQHAAIAALDPNTLTVPQQLFASAVHLFATYAVAVQLASSLPLFAPKSITDGKAALGRDSNSPYKLTIEKCRQNYDNYRALVASSLQTLLAGTAVEVTRPYMRISIPASDPVVGT